MEPILSLQILASADRGEDKNWIEFNYQAKAYIGHASN